LKEAAKKAIDRYGVGAGAVRTIVGNMTIHEQLDQAVATFKREEAAVVFNRDTHVTWGPSKPSLIQAI
jgi:glycine C-acetyltransferase